MTLPLVVADVSPRHLLAESRRRLTSAATIRGPQLAIPKPFPLPMKDFALPALRLLAAVFVFALPTKARAAGAEAPRYGERWRPQFHFTPAKNWMNDPNGMVFFDGEYHLFYQFNPFGDTWGHMSWGHAVSRDLLHWEHLPLAIPETNSVMAFSGSAVVDHQNTSGFGSPGNPPLVAIYTAHHTDRPLQNQFIAHSTDRGRSWTTYPGNPVLDIGAEDFRDPKVFWHEPSSRWIMVVAWPKERKTRFYASPNLKEWSHLSDFGPAGSTTGIWECPDLFPLQIEGERKGKTAWVLVVNVGSGAPAGGSGCQYFVGDFDGTRFTRTAAPAATAGSAAGQRPRSESALWADFGRDFYAAVSWSDIPRRDGRRIWLGWMSNWEYAQDVPTSPWRSAMTVPRDLRLRPTPVGLRLVQQPVKELESLRIPGTSRRLRRTSVTQANQWLSEARFPEGLADVSVAFEPARAAVRYGVAIQTGTEEGAMILADPTTGHLQLDRRPSGLTGFHEKFPGVFQAPFRLDRGRWKLRILVDTSSIEVFVNDGEVAITSLIFPKAGRNDLAFQILGDDDVARVTSIETHALSGVWH